MSADKNDHLSSFGENTSAGAVSHYFFGRVDWPLLLSCFACLWHESCVIEGWGDQSELAGSGSLYEFAKALWKRSGIAPHPSVLMTEYRATMSPKAPKQSPRGKKRVAAAISTGDV